MVLFFTRWPKEIQDRLKHYLKRQKNPNPTYIPPPVNASGSMLKWLRRRNSAVTELAV